MLTQSPQADGDASGPQAAGDESESRTMGNHPQLERGMLQLQIQNKQQVQLQLWHKKMLLRVLCFRLQQVLDSREICITADAQYYTSTMAGEADLECGLSPAGLDAQLS